MRVALNMAVYDKALRMTYGKDGPSLGEIVDVLNNDANKIVNSFHEIIFGVIAPFQIISMPFIWLPRFGIGLTYYFSYYRVDLHSNWCFCICGYWNNRSFGTPQRVCG